LQGTDALQVAARKWARLLHNRNLELYDSQTSRVVFDSLALGDAVRIAPGRTLFYVSTVSGQRVELGHSEPAEVEKWVKALSICNKRSEYPHVDKKRKRIPNEYDELGISAKKTTLQSNAEEEQRSIVNSSSSAKENSHDAEIGTDDSDSDSHNVLQEIAGSNLSEDEYDPEEDTIELELSRQQADFKSNPFDADIQQEIESAHQGSEESSTHSCPPSQHPTAANTVQTNGPSLPRAFINFDDGAFTLRDRPALRFFFERYGEVVDVYLPSFNRKVN
jgi:hypothetical protein